MDNLIPGPEQNVTMNFHHETYPSSCLDYSIAVTSFVFIVYITTMILSFFGNTVALIIFLCHPSKVCPQHMRNRRMQTSTLRRNPKSNDTQEVLDPSLPIKHKQLPVKDQNSFINNHLPGAILQVNRPFISANNTTPSFNYYLASLATSDLLMGLFCIPVTFTQICLGYWPFHHVLCPIVVYAQLVMVTASTLTNTAISLNRLTGILDPMKQRHLSSKNPCRHTGFRIACVWFIALTGSIVQLVVTGVRSEDGVDVCQEGWSGELQNRSIYTIVLFLVLYVIPLGVQGSTYGFISYKLWKRDTPGELVHSVERTRLKEKRRIIKMLIFIVIMFGVCWLPSYLFFLLQDFVQMDQHLHPDTLRVIFGVCHWIAMSNSFVNPMIYLTMSKSFKKDFQQLMKCLLPCQTRDS